MASIRPEQTLLSRRCDNIQEPEHDSGLSSHMQQPPRNSPLCLQHCTQLTILNNTQAAPLPRQLLLLLSWSHLLFLSFIN